MSYLVDPATRTEKLLDNIAGGDNQITPATRREKLLANIEGLPDSSQASTGDVLTLGQNGPEWGAGGGGAESFTLVWGEPDYNNSRIPYTLNKGFESLNVANLIVPKAPTLSGSYFYQEPWAREASTEGYEIGGLMMYYDEYHNYALATLNFMDSNGATSPIVFKYSEAEKWEGAAPIAHLA